jgi:adenylate cyclase
MRGIFGAPERLDMPSAPEEGRVLARRYQRQLWWMVVAGTLFAVLTSLAGTVTFSGLFVNPVRSTRAVLINTVAVVGYFLIFITHLHFAVRKRFRPVAAWLAEMRPSTEDERSALFGLPRSLVVWSSFYWAAVLVWGNIPINIVVGIPNTPVFVLQGFVGIGAGAATGLMASYLLAERCLRPLTGLVMEGATELQPGTVGVLPRMLMAFSAVVVVPFLSLGVQLIGLHTRQRAAENPFLWASGGMILLFGFIVVVVAGRAVTEPVDAVRTGFRRLKDGDFGVDVVVNEPGEIGQLQAGFNEMVAALRERERIRDVFTRLVGKEVAEHALAQGSDLGGEVCQATAMFVDVIGSTPLAQRNTEYGYFMQLNAFFDVVVRTVEGSGGLVNKFEGDGALCVFGAPVKCDDHAARALGAARELREELNRFAEGSGIEAVIGLSTGNVVAGYVGTADRYEFTVVGDAVNEAKRLTEQAKTTDAKVLVSESTIRAAEGEVGNWREAGISQLRGRGEPTVAYQPLQVE